MKEKIVKFYMKWFKSVIKKILENSLQNIIYLLVSIYTTNQSEKPTVI